MVRIIRTQEKRSLMLLAIAFCIIAIAKSGEEEEPQSFCSNSDDDDDDLAWPLRLENGNNMRTITVSDVNGTEERTLSVEKLSSQPPIFRVRNFLTPDECRMLRKLAVEQGLRPGVVDSDDDLAISNNSGGGRRKKKKRMGIFDTNADGRLSINELIRMIDDFFESHVSEDDMLSMLDSIGLSLDEKQNNTIRIQEFVHSDTASMRAYFTNLIRENPSKRSRYSNMAWLATNSMRNNVEGLRVMEGIRQRVATLTKLPEHVVHGAMEMQVVHYDPPGMGAGGGGHYTAHYDSLSLKQEQPCCHVTQRQPPCRPCRMATILYSLSDSGDGGQTAFPLAEAGQQTDETIEQWRMSSASRESSYCAKDGPGLRISPELGQAILWYNHDIEHLSRGPSSDRDSKGQIPPLLGQLDRSTIHAGCPVSKDVPYQSGAEDIDIALSAWDAPGKWIANNWIEASDIAGEDEAHYQKMIARQNAEV